MPTRSGATDNDLNHTSAKKKYAKYMQPTSVHNKTGIYADSTYTYATHS